MPQVKGRSPAQDARLRDMVDRHLDTAAELERAGKFEQAHLMRANLLKPAATYPSG